MDFSTIMSRRYLYWIFFWNFEFLEDHHQQQPNDEKSPKKLSKKSLLLSISIIFTLLTIEADLTVYGLRFFSCLLNFLSRWWYEYHHKSELRKKISHGRAVCVYGNLHGFWIRDEGRSTSSDKVKIQMILESKIKCYKITHCQHIQQLSRLSSNFRLFLSLDDPLSIDQNVFFSYPPPSTVYS